MTEYTMPELFGRRCKIRTGYSGKEMVYRVLNNGVRSNTWSDVPLTYQTESEPTKHDHFEDIAFVVLDTLIDDKSRILRVAVKDIVLLPDERFVETNIFDIEEIHENCTVQVLKNSITGDVSVGWWENGTI